LATNIVPASPEKNAPVPKAMSFVATLWMPIAWATSSSSRMAMHVRPIRASFSRQATKPAIAMKTRMR